MKQIVRIILFIVPMLASYVVFLISFFGWTVYGGVSPLVIMLWSMVVFLFFLNLSVPDLKKIWIFSRQMFFVFSFLLLSIVFWIWNVFVSIDSFFIEYGFQFLAWILLVLGLVILLQSKESVLNNRIKIDSFMLHYTWVFVLAWFVALFIGLYSFGTFKSIPFSCDDLQSTQDNFMSVIFTPVRKSSEVVELGKQWITEFLEGDVDETVQEFITSTGWIDTDISFFQEVKNSVLLATLENKKEVDETVCVFMIDLIQDKRNTPGLQYSVVFLLFLLLYPLLSVVFVTVWILSFLLFSVFKNVGLRDIKQTMKLVEEIE